MKLWRTGAVVVLTLGALGAGDAMAQQWPTPSSAPSGISPGGGQGFPPAGAPGFPPAQAAAPANPAMPPQQGGMPPCFQEFVPLQQEAQKRANVLQEASKKKASPAEACVLFNRFTEAEAKVVKFVTANQANCQIPPDAVKALKTNHAKSMEMRSRVCEAAKGGPKAAGPSLSDALGIRTPLPDDSKPRSGTFDTLTGNALTR
jgi:hypothetical protein